MLAQCMGELLRELEVLALDCQAGGATPAHGDLLELGWALCAPGGLALPAHSIWVVPRTERPIPRAIRELTGWRESCLSEALGERAAWARLQHEIAPACVRHGQAGLPTVIHYARFELPFLHDLHARLAEQDAAFPLDVVCVHAIAARLFPDLPRRNIRALAGYLGHTPELMRRSAGHVEATAFIWRALVPLLEDAGLSSWSQLKAWLQQPAVQARRPVRRFPLSAEVRRALPSTPGVYRFLRRNGDVLYVGKATSLKARVASHFKSRGPASERALELLTQVHEIDATQTASLLEAALLETDEIKRLDPPYNVQLRSGERRAWFASRDLLDVVPGADAAHRVGPLPSQRALLPLCALIALAKGEDATPRLRAMALSVPVAFLPADALFEQGWQGFASELLSATQAGEGGAARVMAASRALWIARGRAELESASDEAAPELWDLARVRRRLERGLVQSGLLVRRARFLCLLADATVAFREREMERARCLVIERGEIRERSELMAVHAVASLPARKPGPWVERQAAFDAGAYDRLRVLLTELRRVQLEGGEIALRVAGHSFVAARLLALMQGI